jgi:hypothetical protein
MKWIALVENPKAIAHLYDEVPPLQGMVVKKVSLDRDGPTLKFNMDLPRFADHKPVRWEKESNTIHLEMDFDRVSDLKLSGWSTNPVFDFSLNQEANGIAVAAGDKDCHISFRCQNIYIQRVTGYTNRPAGLPPSS